MPSPVTQATTAGSLNAQGSPVTVPHPNATTSSGPSPLLLTVAQGTGSASGQSSFAASSVTLHRPATGSSGEPHNVASQRKAICDAWIDAEGEIPVLNKEDASSWTPIRFKPLAIKDPGKEGSWRDGHGVLLDNYFVLLEKDTSLSGGSKSSHMIKPIPLECLRLSSFDNDPEGRRPDPGTFGRIVSCFSSPASEPMYPFTIYHTAAKITRRHTLYTQTATERNRWHTALDDAITARKSQQDMKKLYTPRTLDDEFFSVAPRSPLDRGTQFTGPAVCATEFSIQGRHYLAVGCTKGIYVSDRASNSPFRSVLDSDKPTSMAAIPESNAFLVHCESKLFSYRLDRVIRVSQGDAEPKDSDEWETRLAQDHGDILFFKAGRIANRTFIVYAAKNSKQVTSHVLELICQGENPQYRPLGPPMSTPGDLHDATFLPNEVAICTSKAIYVVEPMNTTNPFREVVPELPNVKHGTNTFLRVLKRMGTLFRAGKSDTRKILGLVRHGNTTLVVYDELGCFIDERGKPASPTYHVSWECRATTYALLGSRLLLFSPGFIEVHDVDTGALVQTIERSDVRLLRHGLTEPGMLVAATTGGAAKDGSRKEILVELVKHGD